MKRLTILILTVLLAIGFSACGKNEDESTDTTYATVNGEIITLTELEYFKNRDRSTIINEFSDKYNVTDFSDFWDKDFDGTTPSQALEKIALDDAVEAKIKLILMKQYGIYDNISFNYLKSLAEKFNESQASQSESVGISSIDATSFYTYYIETGEMELKNKLAESVLAPTEQEIKDYLANKSDLTEDGAKSYLVNEKYDAYITELVNNAEVVKAE